MDDLIKRQDAINSIESHIRTGDELYPITETDKILNHAFEISASCIYNMPSAQPKIIRCGQCKYAEVADKEDAQDGYTCQFHRGSIWFSGSYCSWAERKTDG